MTHNQQHFAILEMAADWHEVVALQPSVDCLALTHTGHSLQHVDISLKSATIGIVAKVDCGIHLSPHFPNLRIIPSILATGTDVLIPSCNKVAVQFCAKYIKKQKK